MRLTKGQKSFLGCFMIISVAVFMCQGDAWAGGFLSATQRAATQATGNSGRSVKVRTRSKTGTLGNAMKQTITRVPRNSGGKVKGPFPLGRMIKPGSIKLDTSGSGKGMLSNAVKEAAGKAAGKSGGGIKNSSKSGFLGAVLEAATKIKKNSGGSTSKLDFSTLSRPRVKLQPR